MTRFKHPFNGSVALFKRRRPLLGLLFSVIVHMVRAFEQFKILKPIIKSVSVFVVDMLMLFQLSPKMFLHQVAVFKDIFSANPDVPISSELRSPALPAGVIFTDKIITIPSILTGWITEMMLSVLNCPRVFIDRFSTMIAWLFHRRIYTTLWPTCQLGGGLPL